MAGEKNHCSNARGSSDGPTVRKIVEDWHADSLGRAIPQGFLDLCRIESDLADQPIPYGTGLFMSLFSDVMAKHEQAARLRAAAGSLTRCCRLMSMLDQRRTLKEFARRSRGTLVLIETISTESCLHGSVRIRSKHMLAVWPKTPLGHTARVISG
jgi:hypothetical protein